MLFLDIELIFKILKEYSKCILNIMFNIKKRILKNSERKKKLILLDTEWACDLVASPEHCAWSFFASGEFMG